MRIRRDLPEEYLFSNKAGWGITHIKTRYCYYACNKSDPRHIWQAVSVCPCDACVFGDIGRILDSCCYEKRKLEGHAVRECSARIKPGSNGVPNHVQNFEAAKLADKRDAFFAPLGKGSVVAVKHLYKAREKKVQPSGSVAHSLNGQLRTFTLYQLLEPRSKAASKAGTIKAVKMQVTAAGARLNGVVAKETVWERCDGVAHEMIPVDRVCLVDVDSAFARDGSGGGGVLGKAGMLAVVGHGNFAVYQGS